MMKGILLALTLSPVAVCHASPASDSLHACLVHDPERDPPLAYAAGKRLADLNAGEPRTVRLFYFLPNDRPFRPEVVQRMKEEILHIQAWYGEQMEAHGYGYKTFRVETDNEGDPVVHRVDGQHPDSHYLDSWVIILDEIQGAFDLSQSIVAVVVDNSNNLLSRRAVGTASLGGKSRGVALVTAEFLWRTLAHELAHIFAQASHHDFRSERYILSYGGLSRNALSACSAEVIAVHPYFNPDVRLEWGGGESAIHLLSERAYPEGSESVPIRLKVSDVDGIQQVRLVVRTGATNLGGVPSGGLELKACRGLMGAEEAVVEIDYDGVIPSGAAFHDLSDPQVHPISIQVVDREGNRGTPLHSDLWEVSRQHLATFEEEEVRGVVFVSGGTTLAFASRGGVKLWNLETRTGTRTRLDGGSLALSADGAILASGSTRGQIQLLDLASDRVTAAFSSGHTPPIRSLAFSSDGTVLASGAPDGIRLWDVGTQTRTATLPVGLTSMALSPNGATLASASEDGVRLWDVATQTEIASYSHPRERWGPEVNTVAFSPDGALVASGGEDATVRLWEVATGENIAVFEHEWPVRTVVFSADGNLLASGTHRVVNLWDPRTKERLAHLRGEGRGGTTMAISSDGTTLAAAAEDGRIGLWDVSEWLEPRPRSLLMVSGDDQQATDSEPLAPLVVEVRDQYGHPLPDVEITFAVTRGEGKVGDRFTEQKVLSDARGRAEATLTPGPGPNTVEVSVEGLEVVTFRSSGTATPPVVGDSLRPLPYGALNRLGKGRLTWWGDPLIAFSPSGALLAVGTETVGIWLYDVAALQEVAWLPAPSVLGLAFSPDGQTLASCSDWEDPWIRLWDVATGNQKAAIEHQLGPRSLAFSPDGRTLASGSDWGLELWEVETGTQMAAASEAEGIWGIRSVAFSPDGSTLAAGSWNDDSVTLWDVAAFTRTATLDGHAHDVTAVAFSPNGRTVASASDDHTVKLWDVATSSEIATFDGHGNRVYALAFSPDGRTVASGSSDGWDGKVHLWDVATGQDVTLDGHEGSVHAVAFSRDGTVASASGDATVRLWDVATRSSTTLSRQHFGPPHWVALSPDGTTLATALPSSNAVHLWDAATGALDAVLEGHAARLNVVAFSPDGTTLASGASDRTVRLWDVSTSTHIATFETPRYVTAVTFSADGRLVASRHGNGTATVWDVATGEEVATFQGQVGLPGFSPDGSTLVSAALEDGRIGLWDLASGDEILGGQSLGERIHSVSFAPDGTALALGWASGLASIWEVPAGADAATMALDYPSARIDAAAFSPDGSLLLSGVQSEGSVVVEVRDVATGTLLAAPKGHRGEVERLAFSQDGSTFASSSHDGTILVWDLGLLLPHPQTLAGLSGDEQEGYPNAALDEPFVVVVRDQNGDPFADAQVTFSVTGGGGTVSVETATTDAEGQASTTLTLGLTPGPNTVEVTVGDLEPVIFTALTQSVPTTLSKVGGDSQQGASGSPLGEPLLVSLLDQAGRPLAGATVTFAVTAGEGTLSVTRATTDAQGRAASILTPGRTPGINTVEVTVAGLAPVTFAALGRAVPQTLTKLAGDEQQGEPGTPLTEALVVSVQDQNGAALPGAVVSFAVLGDGATLSALTDTTDAEGRAATTLTLGEEFGTYTVVATVADLEPVTFTVTAKASPDFDDDGEVGFSDFFLFAEHFGGSDPRFDLDGSGSVDFTDFFLFAEHFGPPARARLVALARELIGLPDGPQLRQNAPNPFNSGTVISWFQLEPGMAHLEVFALTGQRVAVLHRGPKRAGLHRLRWDGRDERGRLLASGVYVYRLVTSEAVQTRKLTLLR